MADKILIVDDDVELRSELRDFLEGYDILEASRGDEAINLLKKAHEIGLIILDVRLPGMNGLDVLTELKKTDPSVGIVILTGYSSKDVAIEALKGRADDYIEKPVDIKKLKDIIERYLGTSRGEGSLSSLDAKGKIEKVCRFVDRNCYRKITLQEAADSVCLSAKYLSRLFKEYHKTGFTGYKLAVKIKGAKDLLQNSGYNINQISDKLGYENTESFIRQFKKLTGQTPTAYRNKRRIKEKKKKSKK